MAGRTVAVVPARKGSKGIPRKNRRELGDRPLVAHAIETSCASSLVDHVALTTDSQELVRIGRTYDVDTVIERPERLAADDVPLAPVIEHAFDQLDRDFEYVLCFQPTVPLVSPDSVDAGIQSGLDAGTNCVIFVRDSTHHYWTETDGEYRPVTNDRQNRQQLDRIYEEIGLFLSHRDLVTEGRRIDDDPTFHEVPGTEGVDIDTYGDWLLAESTLSRKQLLYRVTGNSQTGAGHIYRGITIADHLFEHDICFAVSPDDDIAIEKLDESNYDYRQFENDTAFLDYVRTEQPDVVVNDILNTDATYVQTLTEIGPRAVNFEDLGDGTDHADAVINALFEHSDPPANHYFGFKYICLRNEFRYATPHSEIPAVERVMVSYGGVDENNLTVRTLRALAALREPIHFDVVLGLGYDAHDSLETVLKEFPSRHTVTVSQNVNSMAAHMKQADLLLTSNGRTLYESGSLNLPAISIAQNQREQKHPYAHISRGILTLGQASYVTEENIHTAVETYITDEEERETMRRALAEHDLTNGVERIEQIIFEGENDEHR